MDIKQVFPSKWIKAEDLGGREHIVTISTVALEDVESGKPQLPVVYFQGGAKGLVLNKTNANNISDLYGSETGAWINQQIILFPATTDFNGRTVPCIRCKGPTLGSTPAPGMAPVVGTAPAFTEANPPAPTADPLGGIVDGDDIPF